MGRDDFSIFAASGTTISHYALSPSTVTVRLSMTKVRHAGAFPSLVRHNAINRWTSGYGYVRISANCLKAKTNYLGIFVVCLSVTVCTPLKSIEFVNLNALSVLKPNTL